MKSLLHWALTGLAGIALTTTIAQAQFGPAPKPPTVIGLDSFALVVADLDKAIAFYRDVLGLEVVAAPGKPRIDLEANRIEGTPGAKRRSAVLRVPNEVFALQLVEVTRIDRKAVRSNHNDPGSSFLNFGVAYPKAAFDTLRAARPELIGTSTIPRGDGPGFNLVWLRDPDGHILEVMAGGWDGASKPLVGIRNVYRAHFGMTMGHYREALNFYRDMLGFDLSYGLFPGVKEGEYTSTGMMADGLGIPRTAKMAAVGGHCAFARCEMFEFKDAPRTAFVPRLQDPGAAYLSIWVSDIDQLLAAARAAGLAVLTEGGVPITRILSRPALLPGNDMTSPRPVRSSRDVMLRDPAGFPILLRQRVN